MALRARAVVGALVVARCRASPLSREAIDGYEQHN
jgi:hypothetical protein